MQRANQNDQRENLDGKSKDECVQRVERGAGDVLMEPGNRDDEQMAARQADASGRDIRENQREEGRKRDIHVGKRGSEAAGEDHPDKFEEDSTI